MVQNTPLNNDSPYFQFDTLTENGFKKSIVFLLNKIIRTFILNLLAYVDDKVAGRITNDKQAEEFSLLMLVLRIQALNN